MQQKIVLFILLISIILYYMAPCHVDKIYCAICLVLFFVEAFLILKIELKSKLFAGFNVLFFLSFFLTSFAYPLFVYDTPADLLNVVEKNINFNYLTKSTALCLIASSVYCYGYLKGLRRKKCSGYGSRIIQNSYEIGDIHFIISLYIGVFVVLFTIAVLFARAGGSIALKGGDLLSAIFEALFPVVLLLNTIKTRPTGFFDYVKKNFIILTLSLLMMLAFIRIGDRGLVLTCGMQILVVYSLSVKRPKLLQVLMLLVIGVVLMFSIRQLRMSENYSQSASASSFANFATSSIGEYGAEYGVWYYLSDLTNISHELCLGYEYSKTHEPFHPIEEIVLAVISPIPMLPSLVSNYVFGHPTLYYVTGAELNNYMALYGDAHFGNHCVIDVFMMWRLIGIFVVFGGFGYCVARCYNRIFDSILFAALYIMLASYALYVPRNIVLSLIRPAIYIWFFVWLSRKYVKKRVM